MNNLKLKDLRRYQSIKFEILEIEEQIQSLYDFVKSPSISDIGAGHNSEPSNPVANSLMMIERERDLLNGKYRELKAVTIDILQGVNDIDDRKMAGLIRAHYINGKSWDECADRYGYASPESVRNTVEKYLR